MAPITLSLLTMVRFEATEFNGLPPPRTSNSVPRPHISTTKPSWVVRTESNVRKKRKKKPDPPCVDCEGSGRVDHLIVTSVMEKEGQTTLTLKCSQKVNGQNGVGLAVEVALITAQAAMALENIDIFWVLIS